MPLAVPPASLTAPSQIPLLVSTFSPIPQFCFLFIVFFFFLFFFFFWLSQEACEILVSQPGIEHTPPALEAQSPNHWSTKEVPMPNPQLSITPGWVLCCLLISNYFYPLVISSRLMTLNSICRYLPDFYQQPRLLSWARDSLYPNVCLAPSRLTYKTILSLPLSINFLELPWQNTSNWMA